ncbi:AAA family ATPase, partial [Rhizobium ruizarguesonis]
MLSILYVAIAFPAAQIIIDEPNSFLHPSATRRLLNVLRRFDQHQFLLSTHCSSMSFSGRVAAMTSAEWVLS